MYIIVAVAVVSLAVAAALTIFGEELGSTRQPSAGADSYSTSAIGHKGLVEILERLDVPVVTSRANSADKATNGLLLVIEPTVSDETSRAKLRELVQSAPRVLVVLPKWYGSANPGAEWIEAAHLLPSSEIDDVLRTIDLTHTMGISRLGRGNDFVGDRVTRSPLILHDPQLLDVGDAATPIVTDSLGYSLLLSYETAEHEVHVLTDPDVLNNHGLRHPENALFTVNLIERLRRGGPVVVDEVIHGYAQQPSLFRTLFRFPLVLATMQVLICALLVIWAAMVRFGPKKAAPPPIAPGKDFLIQNTAALLHYGGHHADALHRYLIQSVNAVKHALHAPSLPPTQMTAWLENVRKVRAGLHAHGDKSISLVDLERDAQTADTRQRTVEVADRVYRWRMEMTANGSRHRS